MQHLQKPRGASFRPDFCLSRRLLSLSPTSHLPYVLPSSATPLFATLTKTAEVCTNNSHSGTLLSSLAATPHFWRIAERQELHSRILEQDPMRRRLIRIALILLLFPPLLSAVVGWLAAPAFLHPIRRELTPALIREADASFAAAGATREDFDVKAPDGSPLRGWKVRPQNPNGNW